MAQSNSTKIQPLFKFNLIPPRTVKEVMVIEKRDNSMIYSFGLVFFGLFIFFCLTMIQFILIEPRISLLETRSKERDDTIASFTDEKLINGELFVKARSLSVILEKDIEIIKLLEKSSAIAGSIPSSKILTYEREPTGEFVVTILINDFSDTKALILKARELEGIENPSIKRISIDSDNKIKATIAFIIRSEEQNI